MAETLAKDEDVDIERETADVAGRNRSNYASDTGDIETAPLQPWLLVSFACVAASVVCWWEGFNDAAFVTAALGVVAWFMNQRIKFKKLRDENEHVEDDTADQSGEDDRQG